MIHESQVAKVYGRNHDHIIRKGDKRWTSDNHQSGRMGESYGMNPLSKMNKGILARQRQEMPLELLPDPAVTDLGTNIDVPDGADLLRYVVVEKDGRREWRQRWRDRGGAHKLETGDPAGA